MTTRALRVFAFALAIAWLAVDQGSKVWAEANLSSTTRIPILGGWFGLQLVHNPGAAFGIGTGFIWILTVIAGVAVIALLVLVTRVRNTWWAITIGTMLGGATSHFLDRLLRGDTLASGQIVDFIDWGGLFIGNVADIALVGAACGAVLLSFIGIPFNGSLRQDRATSPSKPSGRSA